MPRRRLKWFANHAARPLGISITAVLLALGAALAFPRLASMSALERAPLTPSAASPASPASPASAPAQASVLIATATVNVNLRASPSTAAARKRLVVAGEPLVVLDASRKDWLGVRSVEGLEGWVMAQYVTLSYQTTAPTVASVQAAFAPSVPAPAPVVAPAVAPAAPVAPVAAPVASTQPTLFSDGVTGVGDSIMLGAAGYLREAIGPMDINAVVGRQTSGAIEALRWQIAQGRLASTVIVHIGTNGTITPDQFDQIMGLVGQRHVVFVNVRVPRSWEGSNNWLLTYKVAQYPNASLVDWYGVAAYRPDFFLPDGIHLSAAGKQAYAAVIAAHLAAR